MGKQKVIGITETGETVTDVYQDGLYTGLKYGALMGAIAALAGTLLALHFFRF